MSSIPLLYLLGGLAIGAGLVFLAMRSRSQVLESVMREKSQKDEAELASKQSKLDELLSLEGEVRGLRESMAKQTSELDAEREERLRLHTELEASKREITEKETSLHRDRQRFLEEKEQLENSFANLSKQALSQAQESFLQMAKEKFADERKVGQKEIDEVLAPMKQTLEQLRVHTQEIESKRLSSYTELSTQVRSLLDSTTKLGNALQRPEVRGSWGE